MRAWCIAELQNVSAGHVGSTLLDDVDEAHVGSAILDDVDEN